MTDSEMTVVAGPLGGDERCAGEASYERARSVVLSLERAAARRQTAGVTLVEVLIVVAIMAMLASGVTFAILPKYKEAQISTARTSARVMRRAVQDWQRVNNEVVCPTTSQLVEGKHLDSGTELDDPWGQPWTLSCTDEEVFVQSNGPDKKQGTADDITEPKVRANSET
jgi:general secretion pathway protein G